MSQCVFLGCAKNIGDLKKAINSFQDCVKLTLDDDEPIMIYCVVSDDKKSIHLELL